jgi:hypothetical protein
LSKNGPASMRIGLVRRPTAARCRWRGTHQRRRYSTRGPARDASWSAPGLQRPRRGGGGKIVGTVPVGGSAAWGLSAA